jgi:hypothetical protein
VQLSDQAAHVLARLILPELMSDPELAHPHALADLPVAGPSHNLPGWDQAGNIEGHDIDSLIKLAMKLNKKLKNKRFDRYITFINSDGIEEIIYWPK